MDVRCHAARDVSLEYNRLCHFKSGKISSVNTTLVLLPCERLVPKRARCLHRVKTFGEVQKPFSTNAKLFRSSLSDISSMKFLA